MEPTSEQELKQLLDEGKITEEEYHQLLEVIHKESRSKTTPENRAACSQKHSFSFKHLPWQIWVVIVLLALTGIGDFLTMFSYAPAIIWFLFKVVTIIGFIKGWKWVFVLFQIVAGIHVLFFAIPNIIAALINLVLMILIFTARRHFFPLKTPLPI